MSTKRDYYEILGVNRDSDKKDIKRSYRKLALKYHPDKNSSEEAEGKFKEISEAYAVLSDDEKRRLYDQYGHAGIDQQFSAEDIFRGADFGDIFQGMGFDFNDIFNQFFGGGFSRRQRSYRGSNLRYDIEISLEEAFNGLKKEIQIPRTEKCDVCNGSGAKPGTSPKNCSQCQGTGQMKQSRRTAFGVFTQVTTCNRCNGNGVVIDQKCSKCRGIGAVKVKRTISISIPPGVDDGSQLRLSGEGEAGSGGVGDLYIVIHLKHHPVFQKRGPNLIMRKGISFPDASLGAKIEINTIDGETGSIKIPDGTQNGSVIKVKRKGMPYLHGRGYGDLFVEIKIDTPSKLSKKSKKLLEELRKELKK
jgi:molecular chaperone DnaJ